MRHTAQVSHTVCMTRLYKCHTQPVQLNKHSAKKKEELYVSKRWHRWQPPSSVTVLMWSSLTEQQAHSYWHHYCCCSHCLRWQWEPHCCIQNSNVCDHITCSYCNIHWNVLTYNDISERASYCMLNSWHNQQKLTYLDFESELHWCTTADEFSSDLMWCVAVQQNIHTEQCKNDSCLKRVSVLSELLLINEKNWININSRKNKGDNICIVKDKGPVSCQLQDTYLYDTYIVVVVGVVAAELVIWESVLTYQSRKVSHTKVVNEEVEEKRKRKVVHEVRDL